MGVNGAGMSFRNGKLLAGFNDGWNREAPLAAVSAPAGEWVHVALTWGGDERCLYMNGALVKSKDYSGKPRVGSGKMFIGSRWTGSGKYFTGDMDEILIYSRCLSAREVAAMARIDRN